MTSRFMISVLLGLAGILMAAQPKNQAKSQTQTQTELTKADLPLSLLLEKQLLDCEVELVKSGQTYIVCDLVKKQIDLKLRGIILRNWQSETLVIWGDPISTKRIDLSLKSALTPPKRDKIKPGEPPAPTLTASGKFQIVNFEISDMPSQYTFLFTDGIEIFVQTQIIDSSWPRLHRALRKFGDWIFPPLKTILNRIKKQKYTHIDWTMTSAEDAQALFWVCNDKVPWLFIFPLPD